MALLRQKSWLPKKLPKAIFWVTSAKMGNLFLGTKKPFPSRGSPLLDWRVRGEGRALKAA